MLFNQRLKFSELLSLHKVCITVMILVLIYDYNSMEVPVMVRIKEPSFSLFGPYNSSATERFINDKPNKLIDLNNFTFLINPMPCQNLTSLLLIIIVSSNPKNVEHRMFIRKTWGRTVDTTKIVFLIGKTSDALESQIRNESVTYGDIVQGNFQDAYRNMTYKHVMGLKWVTNYCPMAKYILKTDDDFVLHPDRLRHFLVKELSPCGTKDLILCQLVPNIKVERSNRSKWMVKPEEYQDTYYPRYCAGFVILYSQNVVPQLLEKAQTLKYFWIDDVHITGVIAEKINISRTPLTSLTLTQSRSRILQVSGPNYVGQYIFGPYDMKLKELWKLWKAMESDNAERW